MRDNYRELAEQIHVPEGMNERVLETVRMQCTANGTGESAKMNRKPMLRAAVCAVLALVLVAGSVSLRSNGDLKQLERVGFEEVCPVGLPLSYEFGLTAYAADAIPAANGNLVLGGRKSSGTIIDTTDLVPEREQYTSYRFRIYGEQIESLTMSIDRGGLYRSEDGKKTVLSGTTVERYDPNVVYGLWVPPAEFLQGRGISVLSGALLTVTVRFSDETEQSNIYRLTAQQLQVSYNEDGTEFLVPALEGSCQKGVFGLYLESLNSVWFCWPVEGSNTVSLSNRYGYRVGPGGQNGAFHAGIDIPAEQGAPVLAAADGTVTEVGFDADRGNYLVLDHGNGMETVYAQCLTLAVEAGDSVTVGQEIAAVGSTGLSTGPHLHFEVRQDGEAQNPVAFFDSEIRDTLRMG